MRVSSQVLCLCKMAQLGDISTQVVLVTLSVIIIFIGYPSIILVFLPIFAYRYAVERLAQSWDPRFGKTLKGLDANLGAHTPYSKPTAVLLPVCYLDSPLERKELLHVFNEKIIQLRDRHGNLVYERLRQKIVRKFGYNFWYNVESSSFKLSDHIRYLNESCPDDVVKQEGFMELTCDIVKRPFDPERSPWEILLIPNFKHDKDASIKSVIIFRFHHCLCDGFSLLKIFERIGVNPWQTFQARPLKKPGLLQSYVLPPLRLLLEAPYQAVKIILFADDDNEWMSKAVEKPVGTLSSQNVEVSMKDLKAITSIPGQKVSLASVVIALVAQATIRSMKRKKANGNLNKIHIVLPWPLPNYPKGGGLCNHWSSVKMPVYVDTEDMGNTVRNTSREYERLRFSVIPQASGVLANLLGALPVGLIPRAESMVRSTCLLSNFPGPGHPIDICGSEVKDWFVMGSPAKGCAVASISFSYNGQLRYIIGGDQCNLSQNDADYLAESCQKLAKDLLAHENNVAK